MSDLHAIARQIYGLKQISRSTGMVTRRAQNALVRNLSDGDLATVAELIVRLQEANKETDTKGIPNAAAAK